MPNFTTGLSSIFVFSNFQNAIAMHESNGIDIIIALLLNEINPLGKNKLALVLELKVRNTLGLVIRNTYTCTLCFSSIYSQFHPLQSWKILLVTLFKGRIIDFICLLI